MYMLRLAPISIDRKNDWTDWDAITHTVIADPDSYFVDEWNPSLTYSTGDMVSAAQYVYISLKNDNADDPLFNYIGRTPEPAKDAIFGHGQNTWLRYRLLSRYLCFNRIQPGYTWSSDGSLEFVVMIKKAMPAQNAAQFYGAEGTSTPLYLVLYDLCGDGVTITYMNDANSVISQKTIPLGHYDDTLANDLCADWGNDIEIPGSAQNVIIQKFDPYAGVTKIKVAISMPTTTTAYANAGLGGFYIGRATRLGITSQDTLSFGFTDYSKLYEDSWGHIDVKKGRVSKNIEASVIVDTQKMDAVFRLLQSVRATPTFFIFTNNLDAIALGDFAIPGITSIMGLVKTPTIAPNNSVSSELTITVDGMPYQFNDPFLEDDPAVCGSKYLPVVPVPDTTVTNPVTPPVSTVPVSGVYVSPETLKGYPGKSYILYASVQPSNAANKKVIWSSSNTGVAEVSTYGVVTAKSVGTCTITATTQDGEFTDSCAVTVQKLVLPDPTYERDVFVFFRELPADEIFIFKDIL